MITINLLPEELKSKPKTESTGFKFSVKEGYFIYLLPLLLALLVCVHIALGVVAAVKGVKTTTLSNKWTGLAAQRKELDAFMQTYAAFSEDAITLQNLVRQRINWAPKLNKLSLNLPQGVWFNELSVNEKEFTLKGSVVSLQKEDMGLIQKFLNSLKNDQEFFADFTNLELSSVQNRTIGGYEVSDFMITGTFKKK